MSRQQGSSFKPRCRTLLTDHTISANRDKQGGNQTVQTHVSRDALCVNWSMQVAAALVLALVLVLLAARLPWRRADNVAHGLRSTPSSASESIAWSRPHLRVDISLSEPLADVVVVSTSVSVGSTASDCIGLRKK